MKKIIALLLVVVIAATALNLVAFARSEYNEGFFKGYQWISRINATSGMATGSFTWAGRTQHSCYLHTEFVNSRGYVVRERGTSGYNGAQVRHPAERTDSVSWTEGKYYVGSNCVYATSARP